MTYEYDYKRAAVTCDVAIVGFDDRLRILLIERGAPPFLGNWALPGGFLDVDEENLTTTAHRELAEETGLTGVRLQQLGVWSDPDRDPRHHTVTAVYFGGVDIGEVRPEAGDDAAKCAWFPLDEIPMLAFDHNDVVDALRRRLARDAISFPTLSECLPPQFAIARLRSLCRAMLGRDPREEAFDDLVMKSGVLEAGGRGPDGEALFSWNREVLGRLKSNGYRQPL